MIDIFCEKRLLRFGNTLSYCSSLGQHLWTPLVVYWIHPKLAWPTMPRPLDLLRPVKQSHSLHIEADIPFSKATLERKWSTTAPKPNTVQNLPG